MTLYWPIDVNVNVNVNSHLYCAPYNQSINQYIYNAPWYRGACYSADYAEAQRNVLSRVLNVITDGAVRQYYSTSNDRWRIT